MKETNEKGSLRNLTPQEIEFVKGQVALMLNYSSPSGSPAKLRKIMEKVDAKDIAELKEKFATLIEVEQASYFKKLAPEEIDFIKGQVALMLNYSSPSGSPAKLKEILGKLNNKELAELQERFKVLFEKK